MRHTRNRQRMKAGTENSHLRRNIPITKSGLQKDIWDLLNHIDPTFKWHRVFNQVSYKEQYKGLESYVVVGLYSKRISRLVNSK